MTPQVEVPEHVKAILAPKTNRTYECPNCTTILHDNEAGFLGADWCEYCLTVFCMNCFENAGCHKAPDNMHGVREQQDLKLTGRIKTTMKGKIKPLGCKDGWHDPQYTGIGEARCRKCGKRMSRLV